MSLPPLIPALGIALALHALALFAIELPDPARTVERVRVTLSVAPAPHGRATDVGAAADQVGTDEESRRSRATAHAAGSGETPPSRSPESRARDAQSPILARPDNTAPSAQAEAARGGGGPAGRRRDEGPAPETRTRTAKADQRAAYLAGWKRRVERAGSRNFPSESLEPGTANRLTLEVTLRADGRLAAAHVVRSSGSAALDDAALDILREAGPFAPFPPALRESSARMTFAYVWRFVPGGEARLSVQ